MPLQITITDAGRAEVINANNTGTGPVTIAEIGLGTGQYEPAPEQTALTAETKRLATIAGQAVSADTIHVTIKDETGDAYTVNEIGLFTDSGTLFAVYSDPVNPIAQKAGASALLLAVDIVLGTLDANSLTFGDTSFAMPPAGEEVPGIAEVATQTETDDGDDDARFVTPKKLRWGFSLSLTSIGYIAFPSWLGGLIVQWGNGSYTDLDTVSFPIAFPAACLHVTASEATIATGGANQVVAAGVAQDTYTAINFKVRVANFNGTAGASNVTWFAVGH